MLPILGYDLSRNLKGAYVHYYLMNKHADDQYHTWNY